MSFKCSKILFRNVFEYLSFTETLNSDDKLKTFDVSGNQCLIFKINRTLYPFTLFNWNVTGIGHL